MACRGLFLSLSKSQVESFLLCKNDEEIISYLQNLEESWDEPHLQEVDKAWDAMHRCLSDGTLQRFGGEYPLNAVVLGGKSLYHASDYIVSFVTEQQTKEIAEAMAGVTREVLQLRYDGLKEAAKKWKGIRGIVFSFTRSKEAPYEGPISDDDFEYTWAYFVEVRNFYLKAASENRAVVFFVDQ